MNDSDSHLCLGQHVPAQPHLGEAALTGGGQELVMANMESWSLEMAAGSWDMVTC